MRVCEDKGAHLIQQDLRSVVQDHIDAALRCSHSLNEDTLRQIELVWQLQMRLSSLIDGLTGRMGEVVRNLVANLQGGIPVMTVQDSEVVPGNLGLVQDARYQITGIGIEGEDEGLDETLREAVDEAEKEKGDGETSERYPVVNGFDGYPAASRNGQHPGDLEC